MSRLFAISDIHGHMEGARRLLELASYRPGTDALVLLGDFIDTDPDTWNTLDEIRAMTGEGAVAVAGNMERALLDAAVRKGGMPAVNAVNLEFLRELPLYWLKEPYLFVHAGLRPHVPLDRQTAVDLTTIRQDFWNGGIQYPYSIIFGHTPTHRMGAHPGELWHGPGRLGIDTGAKHGLRLTLVELTGRIAYSCSTAPANLYGDIRQTGWDATRPITRRYS